MGHPIYSPCPHPGSASEPCDSLTKPCVITPLYNVLTLLIGMKMSQMKVQGHDLTKLGELLDGISRHGV